MAEIKNTVILGLQVEDKATAKINDISTTIESLRKRLDAMAAAGQANTDEFKQLSDTLAQLQGDLGKMNSATAIKQIDKLALSVNAVSDDLTKLEGKAIDVSVDVVASDEATAVIQRVNEKELSDKQLTLNADNRAGDFIDEVNAEKVNDKQFSVTTTDEASRVIDEVNADKVADKHFNISATNGASAVVDEVNADKVADKELAINATDNATKTIDEVNAEKLENKNLNVTADFKSARAQLKALREEMLQLEQSGQRNTDRFRELQAQAGGLADQIGDTQAQIKAMASDTRTLDTLLGVGQGLAGAFAVAQGAAALFGEENEDLQKAMMKVQASLALLNGVQAVANVLNKDSAVMVNLHATAQKIFSSTLVTSIAKMNAFKLSLATTGVGALIVAIGLLAQYFSNLSDEVEEAKKKQDDYNKSLERQKALVDQTNTNAQLRNQLLAAQGQAVEAARSQITIAENEIRQEQEFTNEKLRQRKKLIDAGYAETDQYIQEIDKRVGESEARRLKAQITLLESQKTINDAARVSADEAAKKEEERQARAKKLAEERAAKEQEVNNIIAASRQALLMSTLSDNEKELEAIDQSFEERLAKVKGNEEATNLVLEELRVARQAKLDEQAATAKQKEDERLAAELEQQKAEIDYKLAVEEEYYAQQQAMREKAQADEKAFQEARVSFYNNASQSIVTILQAFGNKSKGFMLAALALEKGVAIANVIINLQKEIAGISANAAANPANALTAGVAGATQAATLITMAKVKAGLSIAAIAATGLNQAKSISGGGGGGGGGGSVSAGGASGGNMGGQALPPPTATNPNSQLLNPPANGQGQGMRAYVVESDIRSVSGRLRRMSEFATLGA